MPIPAAEYPCRRLPVTAPLPQADTISQTPASRWTWSNPEASFGDATIQPMHLDNEKLLAVTRDCLNLNIYCLRTTVTCDDIIVTSAVEDHRTLRDSQLKAARMIITAIELERVVLDQVLRDAPADDVPF